MSTRIGIVGMPNAGKSSLFNALTKAGAEAANYPFTTIEPNVAVVPVRDERMEEVAQHGGRLGDRVGHGRLPRHRGAGGGGAPGRGPGQHFLANIRETHAIVHVVRAHNDENVIHPEGRVDPLADIETIETELVMADLEAAERRVEKVGKQARGGDRVAVAEEAWLREVIAALQAGRPARTVPVPEEAPNAARDLGSLTSKPVLFVANVDEGSEEVPAAVAEHAAAQGARAVAVSSRIEAELAELEDEDAAAMREELIPGPPGESGLQRVVREAFALLELIAFFTAGEATIAQSWHLRRGLTAWHAAGRDPHGHPEGLRARRGDRLAGARRRGRLRGRARARHAAPGGPRLRHV